VFSLAWLSLAEFPRSMRFVVTKGEGEILRKSNMSHFGGKKRAMMGLVRVNLAGLTLQIRLSCP